MSERDGLIPSRPEPTFTYYLTKQNGKTVGCIAGSDGRRLYCDVKAVRYLASTIHALPGPDLDNPESNAVDMDVKKDQ